MRELREKIRIIVTFIALLEMVKMGKVKIKISKELNDFILVKT
jgi:segregation and condensation protein A